MNSPEGKLAVAVETKVDSNGFRQQLVGSADSSQRGILLAVGTTALLLTPLDLPPDLAHWRSIGPREWANSLTALDLRDEVLAVYRDAVEREAAEHEQALKLAWEPERPLPRVRGARISSGYLEDFAWLAEVRRQFSDPSEWETKALQSGPLMGFFPSAWKGKAQLYLEFMCQPSRAGRTRSLCLKAGWGRDALQRVRNPLTEFAVENQMTTGRRPGPSAGSCTCARRDLTDARPDEAAMYTTRFRDLVAPLASTLVR